MKHYLEKGGEVEVILVFKETAGVGTFNDLFGFIKDRDLFKGDAGEVYSHISHEGDSVVFLGLGEEEKLQYDTLRKSFFSLGGELQKKKIDRTKVR
mgnify:FL=1